MEAKGMGAGDGGAVIETEGPAQRPADGGEGPGGQAAAEAGGEAGGEASGRGPSKVLSGEPCDRCGAELSAIRIEVDGRALVMESCNGCDVRRWQLAGERIDLAEALNQVGEHAGRRR